MLCNRVLKKYVQIDIIVTLICLTYGSGNYLNVRNLEYGSQGTTDNDHGVKTVEGAANAESGLVENSGNIGAVGEVFVPKTFPLGSQEPTCEQLRAMWIFSKRQSRAAEITNEIPTYRDPFTYNVWEPLYSSSRTLGSIKMDARERSGSPVFGRVVSREPVIPQRANYGQRQRLIEGGPVRYGVEPRPNGGSSRRSTQSRYMGGPSPAIGGQNSVPIQGSFRKLKELIWTERSKELTQQRRAEELAARAAVLKEIANGQNIQSSYKPIYSEKSDFILMDENRSPDRSVHQYMADSRMPIADGQALRPIIKNEHNNAGIRASARSYSSRLTNGHGFESNQKEIGTLFSGNSATGQSSRISRIKLPGTELNSGHFPEREQSVIGIPKTYPIRQSHFRERNRSLLKQYSPAEYFQRSSRNLKNLQIENSKMELPKINLKLNENAIIPKDNMTIKSTPIGLFLAKEEINYDGKETTKNKEFPDSKEIGFDYHVYYNNY